MQKNTVLYKHIRKLDGIIFYIGIGNIKRPYSKIGRNNYWYNMTKKYDYYVEIIADNLTWCEACELEKKFISFYGRKNKGLGSLVNLTDGGDGTTGFILSEKQKLKISKRNSNEKNGMWGKKGDKHHFYGKKHSEDTRLKISKSIKGKNTGSKHHFYGKKHSEDTRLKISKSRKSKNTGSKHHFYGKKHLEDTRLKISKSRKGKTIGLNNVNATICLDKINGIFYTLGEVIEITGFSQYILNKMLLNKKTNKTNFILV